MKKIISFHAINGANDWLRYHPDVVILLMTVVHVMPMKPGANKLIIYLLYEEEKT